MKPLLVTYCPAASLYASLGQEAAKKNGLHCAPVSTGTTGRETPAGVFAVLEKQKDHHSSLYDDAWMPHMLRITWNGIALHGDTPERHRAAARTFPGNFLFSTGPNTQGGGKRNTRGHYDVPMRDCTVALDGKVIIERGKIVDEKMRVKREPR